MNTSSFLAMCFGLLLGAVVGVALYVWWRYAQANAKMRLPDTWPLTSRVLLTNEEHEVFKWLRNTFHDHLVMIKLPVLRFTIPISKDKNGGGPRWQDLLGGVYCTFTVCTTNGNVVGCVDVPARRGLKKANRDLKESLLSDCRIGYTVVRSVKLPKASAMRAAFLGELLVDESEDAQITLGGDSSFQADLTSFTKEKRLAAKAAALQELNNNDALKPIPRRNAAGFNPDGSGMFPSKWDDSFALQDESRPAKLREL